MINFWVNCVQPTISLWIFFYALFNLNVFLETYVLGEQLASGHIFCGMLCIGSFLSTFCYLDYYKHIIGSGTPHMVMTAVFAFVYFHTVYGLFYTSFIYHNADDSMVGLCLGAITSYFLFFSDLWKTYSTIVIADVLGYRDY